MKNCKHCWSASIGVTLIPVCQRKFMNEWLLWDHHNPRFKIFYNAWNSFWLKTSKIRQVSNIDKNPYITGLRFDSNLSSAAGLFSSFCPTISRTTYSGIPEKTFYKILCSWLLMLCKCFWWNMKLQRYTECHFELHHASQITDLSPLFNGSYSINY